MHNSKLYNNIIPLIQISELQTRASKNVFLIKYWLLVVTVNTFFTV